MTELAEAAAATAPQRDDQYFQQVAHYRRKGRRWIGWLWPLLFLLIFAFTQSLAGLIVSLAIIVVIEAFISTAPFRPPIGNMPPNRQAAAGPYSIPEAEMPYEQGYPGTWSGPPPSWPRGEATAYPTHPAPSLLQQMGPGEESDRLARLKLLGDLHQAGVLTDEEFETQKWRVRQANTPEEASEAEMQTSAPDGEQPELDYPQELPPMQH
jgi:hypothetical protein